MRRLLFAAIERLAIRLRILATPAESAYCAWADEWLDAHPEAWR